MKRLRSAIDRLLDRLGRSSSVFFVVLIVLCGVEVAVDWNSTLYEINVLRSALKQKAENYADLLRKAAEPAILDYDADELDRLSHGLFDDDELVYVRFTDLLGNTLYDRLRPDYATSFSKTRGDSFRAHYRRPMTRDIAGIAEDPVALQKKMERSRHRDFIQAFTDGENALIAHFAAPQQNGPPPLPRVLYQDRLGEAGGARDQDTSYAVGAITAPDGQVLGVVLVAFRHDKLNHAVLGKLLKGLGIVLFFVALILVQNVMSRRAKLRLFDLEAALLAARQSVRAMLPPTPTVEWAELGVGLVQAARVGGTIYHLRATPDALELFLAVPVDDGVEAAFASVELASLYRRLAEEGDLSRRAVALLGAYDNEPLSRPVDLLLMRAKKDGSVEGVCAGLTPPSLLDKGEVRQIAARQNDASVDAVGKSRLRAPLQSFAGQGQILLWAREPDRLSTLLQKGATPSAAVAQLLSGKTRRDEFALVVAIHPSA